MRQELTFVDIPPSCTDIDLLSVGRVELQLEKTGGVAEFGRGHERGFGPEPVPEPELESELELEPELELGLGVGVDFGFGLELAPGLEIEIEVVVVVGGELWSLISSFAASTRVFPTTLVERMAIQSNVEDD